MAVYTVQNAPMPVRSSRQVLSILLIEDDPIDQEATRRALAQAGFPFKLQVASDGAAGLACLRSGATFDLVLLDLKMPRCGGIEVLADLHTTPPVPIPPVVVLTSSDSDADRRSCWAHGVRGYFIKPLAGVQLTRLMDVICSYWSLSLPSP
ncbi:MAG TPA: response regulator [Planctomycetota bacterium]